MKIPTPVVDYSKLKINNINSLEYRHLKKLLYWPVFGLLFWYAENLYPVAEYYVMYHPVDSMIPFNELFVLPYLFWFIYLIGIHLYTLLYDIDAFDKLMDFIIITNTAGLVIFFLFPTCQMLRPAVMPRDNILTQFMTHFYAFDTNTNVCPSLHVVGSAAVSYAAWNAKGLNSKFCRGIFSVITILISVSTVFLKQHSVIDVVVAIVVCLTAVCVCSVIRYNSGEKQYSHRKLMAYK